MSTLRDKTAVVTGGATGIGLAIAKRFAADGAYVFITGRRQSALDAAVAEIGEKVEAVRADSAKLADLDMLYSTVQERRGNVDILVANSGGGVPAALGDITEEQPRALFRDRFAMDSGVGLAVARGQPGRAGRRTVEDSDGIDGAAADRGPALRRPCSIASTLRATMSVCCWHAAGSPTSTPPRPG
jgi:hypothetical protein